MQITFNGKQAIAIIWTLVALALAWICTGYGFYYLGYSSYYYVPWGLSVALFFGILLVITLPVYLLLALWHILAKNDSE